MTEIGSTLGGRYRLLELLGQGGMATIFRAHDAQLGRDVAVKLLRPEFGQDPDFLQRFREEARSAASLSHPNIVAVHDFGQDAFGPYIVMELVEGQDLGAIIREQGALAPRQAARISAEVAKALHAAHVRGIVHRDVKPSNVLVAHDGRVKVADFGIARALTESQLTLPGTTMGSVHYFSPEQARGENATVESDVYALGIVLFESLTGQRPFTGDGAAAVALARLNTAPPRPSTLRPSIPAALDGIVLRAMALEPGQRFASAAAMASALEGFLSERADTAPVPTPVAGAAVGAAAGLAAAGTVASSTARPNPGAVPYPPDAYAARPPATTPPPPATPVAPGEDDEGGGSGPWAWIAGILGIAILALVGFVVFQLLTGGNDDTPTGKVTVPSLIGKDVEEARGILEDLGLELVQAGTQESTEPVNSVIAQDPLADTEVSAGSQVRVILARGRDAVAVPDLRAMPESEALQLIVAEGLTIGTREEVFDAFIAVGSIVNTNPGPGLLVAPAARIDYQVSKGPEPSPSPTATPSPTPQPTPPPTPPPTPTPAPTPTPTPTPISVGNYVCMTRAEAETAIGGSGLSVAALPADAPAGWFVATQNPAQGTQVPPGSSVAIGLQETKPASCP